MAVVKEEEEEENELKAFLDREVCNKTSAMFFKVRLKEVRKQRNICSVLKIKPRRLFALKKDALIDS